MSNSISLSDFESKGHKVETTFVKPEHFNITVTAKDNPTKTATIRLTEGFSYDAK